MKDVKKNNSKDSKKKGNKKMKRWQVGNILNIGFIIRKILDWLNAQNPQSQPQNKKTQY